MAILLYNSLTNKKELFKPLKDKKAGIYTCGPTVYNYTHIGHLRKYIGDDILKRVLKYNGYKVKHVMNITDVGHLVSDEDAGEDKMEKGARETGRTVWEVAKFFEKYFFKSIETVNIEKPDVVANATKHLKEQVNLVKKLLANGYAYKTGQAIYFDISKFPDYTKLSKQRLAEKITQARKEVVADKEKKHPLDFALWFFTVGRFKNHTMRWPSPWGTGFPGWHIECSAMAMKYLGDTLDIHTGGIDHIPVHHSNEIAQSEAATGKKFVNYWVHHEFLVVDGEKMSKSKKNFYTVDDLIKKGFNPLSFRYLTLNTHYRSKLNFTWQGLQASQNALENLYEQFSVIAIRQQAEKQSLGKATRSPRSPRSAGLTRDDYKTRFLAAANDDLNTPQALAVMWKLAKDEKLPAREKKNLLLEFDKVFGLGLDKIKPRKITIPVEARKLADQREKFRQEKKWQEADKIRKEIESLGYQVEDTPSGPVLNKS